MMNAEQIQKWSAIREKGRTNYLLKKTLRWGAIFSLVEIIRLAFIKFTIAKPIVDSLFYAIFARERTIDTEDMMVRFIANQFFHVFDCFLLAGVLALAVWTYKEQSYYSSITAEAGGN
jgi:hypothetical protein